MTTRKARRPSARSASRPSRAANLAGPRASGPLRGARHRARWHAPMRPLVLAVGQLVDDALPLDVIEHHPAADFLDRALAAEAEAAALGVDHADADAARHHASRRRRRSHGFQDFLLSSASWPCSSSSLRFRSSIAASLLAADDASDFGSSWPLACAGGVPPRPLPSPLPTGFNMRMPRPHIAI